MSLFPYTNFVIIFPLFSALEAMVNFAYTGQISVNRFNAQSLLIAANFLHLAGIRDACCTFFKERLVHRLLSKSTESETQ
jgi:hypothetical protein